MDVMKVMAPATLSSGMLHINVYTDLYFASYIVNAAAAMRYANFIVLTPLGIISNMILVPFMPVFSRLAAPENWADLKLRIRQGLLLTALTMLPLTAIFIALSEPIVKVIYERGMFKADASAIVAPVLMAYGLGMFFYLARDVLVRVFYALGDGETPFRISIFNIFLNAILDYLLVDIFATPGLVFATIGVNVVSLVLMLGILHKRLNGFPLGEWGIALFRLVIATIISGFASWGVSLGLEQIFNSNNLFLLLINLTISTTVALVIFASISMQLKLPEVELLTIRIRQKLKI
jgi:putative peptidoglycan lipid II flippase